MPVLIAFVIVPLTEIAVFTLIGQILGLWPTVALAFGLGAFGAALLRYQGLATLRRMMARLERGEAAFAEVIEGIWLVLAGLLLLTPGFVSDAVGLLLFIPALRHRLGRWLISFILRHGQVNVTIDGQTVQVDETDLRRADDRPGGVVIEPHPLPRPASPSPGTGANAAGAGPEVEILPPDGSKWGAGSRFRS